MDQGIEVAIVGRSNSGKSSILNLLTQNKSLARVSKTPGRTQLINLFGLDGKRRIADLPGYGYAEVPHEVKIKWQQLLDDYLRTRECLRGLLLIMDIRHPLKPFDEQMLTWCADCDVPVHIILNKADKLSNSAVKITQMEVTKAVAHYPNEITVQVNSCLKGTGAKELRDLLNTWFT
jgi:GTP-binding protein